MRLIGEVRRGESVFDTLIARSFRLAQPESGDFLADVSNGSDTIIAFLRFCIVNGMIT